MSKEFYKIGKLKMPKVGKDRLQVILDVNATSEQKVIAKQKLRKEAFDYANKVYSANEAKLSDKYTRESFNKIFVSFLTQEAKSKEVSYFGKYKKEITTLSIKNASNKIQNTDVFLFGKQDETTRNKRFARNIIRGNKLEKNIKLEIYGGNEISIKFKSLDYNNAIYDGHGFYNGTNFELVKYFQNGKSVYILITYVGKYNNEQEVNFANEEIYNEYKKRISYR